MAQLQCITWEFKIRRNETVVYSKISAKDDTDINVISSMAIYILLYIQADRCHRSFQLLLTRIGPATPGSYIQELIVSKFR